MHHINQLKSVVALARLRHFGRAADSIGLTQSALSQNIRKVEELYGVSLFERRNRQVSLTAYGEVVYQSAQQSLAALKNAEREIQLMQSLETGQLVVCADPYFATSIMAPALSSLLNEHPQLRFTARNGYWANAEQQLLNDDIDLFFSMLPESRHTDIHYQVFEVPTPLILCSPDHPLARQGTVTLPDAIDYPIATSVPPAWYVHWAEAQIKGHAESINVSTLMRLEADNIEMVKTVALNSLVLTSTLPSDAAREIDQGKLLVLKLENWPNTMFCCVATRASRALPPAVDELRAHLERAIRQEFVVAKRLPSSGHAKLPSFSLP